MRNETRVATDPMLAFKKALDEAKANLELAAKTPDKNKIRSQRAELFRELYSYYDECYKKDTWSSYRRWLARNKLRHSPTNVQKFKSSGSHFEKIAVSSFCSHWLGFIKTEDLPYLISIAKDKAKRKENFNKWLFWAIKTKV